MAKKAADQQLAEHPETTSGAADTGTATKRVNKSEEIRKTIKSDPGLSAPQIRDKLARRGVDVSLQQIYTIRNRLQERGTLTPKRRGPRPAASGNGGSGLDDLMKVKKIAEQFGGLDRMAEMITVLKQLQS
ncbi:MAG: hypothetical protein ACK4RK_19580 [Gemmataceae bacterium]